MATYFHGHPEIQSASASAEGLQTLVLMNPAYVQYSDSSAPLFLNSAVPQLPPATSTQFLGVPLGPTSHELHGMLPRLQYNLYNHIDQASPVRDTPRGLSLSLSSQQRPHQTYGSPASAEDMRISAGSGSPGSVVTNGISGLQSSKYLVAAQELLDELVNVNSNALKSELEEKRQPSAAVDPTEGCAKRNEELTNAERQEIQMKKAKLISMLDEVEQRYRQYDHQMQIVKSSFEQAAGIGSADTYTSLALGTISKQFKCLKDAIVGQVKVANKALGEEDSFVGKPEGSRLKYVDHHYRQQRALQQLGMIQQNAWRPQRGLPERSVSVLRAWLFEHFLHPYPKDSDKHMLAKQTGLTRSQVSNWFINARVRLWKPMVEEMYLEEIKDQEKTSSDGKPGRSDDVALPKENTTSASEKIPNPSVSSINSLRNLSILGNSDFEGVAQISPKKARSADMMQSNMDIKLGDSPTGQMPMKFDDERQSRDGFSFFGGSSSFIGGFGQYPIGDIGRFEADHFAPRFGGNGVSLTLGLPNQELMSLSGSHQSFIPNQTVQLGRRLDLTETNEFGSLNSPAAFDSSMNSIPSRKRFAAQLLPTDFVT